MRNVSNKYIETMRTRRDFYAIAEIAFADGVQKALNKEDFILSGNSITQFIAAWHTGGETDHNLANE